MSKRISSFVMALVMLLSLMPLHAFAATTANVDIATENASAGETVEVDVVISGLSSVNVCNFYGSFTLAEGLTLVSVTAGDNLANFTNGVSKLGVFQYDANDAMNGATIEDGIAFKLAVEVADDAVAGDTYAIGMNIGTFADSDLDDITYTVNAGGIAIPAASTTGYTATLTTSAVKNEVVSEGSINVNVTVSHNADTVFNAGEIKLTYDSTNLNPDTNSLDAMVAAGTLSGYKIKTNELVIEDFGADKTMPYSYSIPFTAAKVITETTDTVTLTRAAFIHKDNADSSDLIDATKSPEFLTVTIKVAMVNVTLTNSTDHTSTTITTQKEVDYTFAPADIANYTYSNVTATVGNSPVDVTDNGDGSFTIAAENVTGDITLTYTKTAKSYTVNYEGDGANDIANKPTAATYGQNLTVTLPDDIAPSTTVGYTYGINAKIGDTSVGTYDSTTRTLTIHGTDITGNITITVTKQKVSATQVTITVSGDSGLSIKGVTGNTTNVAIGTEVTLVLTKEDGYTYKVVDSKGNEVTFNENGEYTFNASVTEIYTVTKTLDVSTVQVTEYVKVDNYVVYLVTYDGTLASDVVPTYDGKVMFWSDKYDAYCWLVIDSTLTADTAKTKIDAQAGNATEVDYGMDINGTNVTDAADAQMVWNMYNALYSDFTSVSMARFLAADQNATSDANWGLNVQDAQVIITAILAGNATT